MDDIIYLFHFNNNFTDSSPYEHSSTNHGVTFSSQNKFGGYSANFDGSSYLSLSPNDLALGSYDFEIDYWFRSMGEPPDADIQIHFSQTETIPTNYMLMGYQIIDNGDHYSILATFTDLNGDDFLFAYSPQPLWTAPGVWNHVRLARHGDFIGVAMNGVYGDLVDITGRVFQTFTNDFILGFFPAISMGTTGQIDELRIRIGTSDALVDFTPPTKETETKIANIKKISSVTYALVSDFLRMEKLKFNKVETVNVFR